jgi:GT2 family glycosyltransferase
VHISIIIPTKNRKEDLLITLRSVIQQSCPPEEVVVIDQSQESCREGVLELFKTSGNKLDLIYLWDKEIPGLAEARALGVKKSGGEIVFFLDDDITLDRNCIENLLKTYEENPHLGGIGGVDTSWANKSLWLLLAKSIFTCGPLTGRRGGWFFTGWLPHYFHNRLTTPYPSWWLLGGIMSFKKHVVEEIGFDKQLVGHVFMDDVDLTFRASKKYCLVIDPKVRGYHRGGMVAHYNTKENYEKRISGEWYFFKKNIEKTPLNILLFLWSFLGRLLGALFVSLAQGTLDPLRGFLRGMSVGARRYRNVSFSREKPE